MEETRRLECPHCGKRYRVQPGQIPAGTKAIRCQACGKAMPVGAVSQPKPVSGPTVILECSVCGKQYRVPEARIPSGRSEVPCKACGGSVPLPGAEPDFDATPQWDMDTDTDAEDGDAYDRGGHMDPSHVRLIRTAIGAGVVMLVLLIGLGVYYLWPRDSKPATRVERVVREDPAPRQPRRPEVKPTSDRVESEPETPAQHQRPAQAESESGAAQVSATPGSGPLAIDPFWAGCIDVHALVTQVNERGGENFNVTQPLFMVQTLGLQDLQWAVYREQDKLGLVACLRAVQARQLEAMLLASGPLDPNIQQVDMHHYRVAAEVTEGVACEDIDLMFAEDAVWLTSASLLENYLQDAQSLAGLPLMQRALAARSECHCVSTALVSPENVQQWIADVMQAMQEETEDFNVIMTLGMIEGMLAPCYAPLEQMESLALNVGLPPKDPNDPSQLSVSLNLTLRDEAVTRQSLEIMQQEPVEQEELSWGLILRQMTQSNDSLQVEQVDRSIQLAWTLDLEELMHKAFEQTMGVMMDSGEWDDETEESGWDEDVEGGA